MTLLLMADSGAEVDHNDASFFEHKFLHYMSCTVTTPGRQEFPSRTLQTGLLLRIYQEPLPKNIA